MAASAFLSASAAFLSCFFDSRSSCLAVNFIWKSVLSSALLIFGAGSGRRSDNYNENACAKWH